MWKCTIQVVAILVCACTREPVQPKRATPPPTATTPEQAEPKRAEAKQQPTAGGKPLAEGVFEIKRVDTPDGKSVELAKVMFGGPDVVWGRLYIRFDGDEVAHGSQRLTKKKGIYSACEVEVRQTVVWSSKGYTVTNNAKGRGRVTHFKKLTPKESSADQQSCEMGMEKGTFELLSDPDPTIKAADGTLLRLAAVSDNIDKIEWSSKLKK